jgi:hypothetical protein
VGKVNWTIVAISAGVTMVAGVAVLGDVSRPASTDGGIIVPQATEGLGDQPVRPPVRPKPDPAPDPVTPPPAVAVVTVNPAGYTQSLSRPRLPARLTPVTPVAVPAAPVVRIQARVRPGQLVNRALKRVRSLVPLTRAATSVTPGLPGFGWFVNAGISPGNTSTLGLGALDGGGRHRADSGASLIVSKSTDGGGGRHRARGGRHCGR